MRSGLAGSLIVLLVPQAARAAGPPQSVQAEVWAVIPFVGLLLTIALLPVFAGRFWHSNLKKALVAFLFAAPVAGYLVLIDYLADRPGIDALVHGLKEYLSFIILLGSLYVVAGGILIQGDLLASPRHNTLLLGSGAVLANLVGTTGASMILVRPYLRFNRHRQQRRHLPVFFIFSVSNLGGLLTPLGDPPLFLGFLNGVDFFWTLKLWPEWLLANALVLAIFFVWDSTVYRREPKSARQETSPAPFHVRGRRNVLLLAGILAAILFQSDAVSEPVTRFVRRFFPCPDLQLVWPYGEAVMVLMSILCLVITPRSLRLANKFHWGALVEVAILFAGIFITMVPALDLLGRHGRSFGLSRPWEFFWLTGGLSAFLDNAPTYLTFATIASGGQPLSVLTTQAPDLLRAISCGAVFLGAMTYIGNGPNFMVKAIAEEDGLAPPSFFGYLLYSCAILLPIFILVSFIFF